MFLYRLFSFLNFIFHEKAVTNLSWMIDGIGVFENFSEVLEGPINSGRKSKNSKRNKNDEKRDFYFLGLENFRKKFEADLA